jgi:hypothetical protein
VTVGKVVLAVASKSGKELVGVESSNEVQIVGVTVVMYGEMELLLVVSKTEDMDDNTALELVLDDVDDVSRPVVVTEDAKLVIEVVPATEDVDLVDITDDVMLAVVDSSAVVVDNDDIFS